MGRYNDNTGKWRNYVTKPMACTVEGTGGSTFGAGARYGSGGRTVEAIVINESKEEIVYDINVVNNGAADEYQWRYSEDGGTTWASATTPSDSGFNVAEGTPTNYKIEVQWISLDEGVRIKFNTKGNWNEGVSASEPYDIKITTPSLSDYLDNDKNKIYFNGWTTSLDAGGLVEEAGGGEGFGAFSEPVVLDGDSYTILSNYTATGYVSYTTANNYRTTLEIWGSVDGTNYVQLDSPLDDIATNAGEMYTGIFDKKDNDQGGDMSYYKFRVSIPTKGGGTVRPIPERTYFDVALIKNY